MDPSMKVVSLFMETPDGGYCRQKASQASAMTGHYSLLIFVVELWAAVAFIIYLKLSNHQRDSVRNKQTADSDSL